MEGGGSFHSDVSDPAPKARSSAVTILVGARKGNDIDP
jgi:hypothetical protein